MGSERDYVIERTGIYPRGFSLKTEWPWPLVQSAEIVTLHYGKALRATERVHGSVPVYGTNGQCGWHNESLQQGPGVILGRKGQGPLGVKWCDTEFWVIDTAYFVQQMSENINLRYFFYVVNFIGLNHLKDGTSNPSLSRDTFTRLLIPLPPMEHQKAIAHILSTLDDKIELNRQMNMTLESMAQAMFKSWFVDFDPVIDNALAAGNPIPEPLKAKAEARKALGDKRKPLPQDIQELFPSRFVFTEDMGWIPEGWEVSTVGDQVKTAGGGTPSTKDNSYWDGGVHAFCTPKDMSRLNSIVMTDTERHLTDAGVNKISSGQLKAGVVLMSSRAPIGYLAISNIPVSVNQGIIAMIPSEKYGSMYLHLWAHFNMRQITDRANGSTFMEISKKNFRPIPFLVPEDMILKYFNDQSHSIYLKLLSISENVVELTNLRDTLLPKLISGQLRLPDSLINKFAEQADSHDAEQIISEAI